MKLIIEGNDRKVKRFQKEFALRCKRNGLKMSTQGEQKPTVEDVKPLARDVIALIEKVEKLEDLKQYESDNRATVKKAFDAKTAELSE